MHLKFVLYTPIYLLVHGKVVVKFGRKVFLVDCLL